MFWKKKKLHYTLDHQPPLNKKLKDMSFTIFDTETTGFAVGAKDRLLEIGAVHVEGLQVTDMTFHSYVNPEREIPKEIKSLTGITEEKVKEAPKALEAIEQFFQFIEASESAGWVGHYVSFDVLVLKKELKREKHTFEQPQFIDTLDLIGYLNPSWDMRDLSHYARTFGTNMFERHSAIGDALTTAYLFVEMLRLLEERGKTTLADLLHITDNPSKALL
ncbi:3'-5' exonuclease [Alkalihalobacillus sp. LMS39]|uniref:3'-5' exonuclease n=1 Tax=Alkalihalobacillus sp. LMS39 TaxID=2924032 RepID=UPI001FB51584|nr:3'-5' exonuclease [Alkalihalobacillus sp. LMS39]UOE93910.1 3'-5' exonuclease [Alkalihalobacillus sp. LMS39]